MSPVTADEGMSVGSFFIARRDPLVVVVRRQDPVARDPAVAMAVMLPVTFDPEVAGRRPDYDHLGPRGRRGRFDDDLPDWRRGAKFHHKGFFRWRWCFFDDNARWRRRRGFDHDHSRGWGRRGLRNDNDLTARMGCLLDDATGDQ
jgi:hypothetical protein